MLNKQTLALKSKSTGAEIFYPMEQRCNFLRELLKTEPAAEVRLYLRSIDLGQMRENHRKPSKVHDSSLLSGAPRASATSWTMSNNTPSSWKSRPTIGRRSCQRAPCLDTVLLNLTLNDSPNVAKNI